MVRSVKVALLVIMAAAAVQSCVVADRDRADRRVRCGGEHRLQVLDLDISPDPVAQGQRINAWHVRIRADASGECQTTIRVFESAGNELVAQERVSRLRPGINQISLDPIERYRFSRNEHCFSVTADIEGTRRTIDAARRFCARRIADRRWSMR
ncbi:MAG: hypothetical protein HY695_12695 [Deltaproteobacteria bacterium]|nr:hypothetical protein [Deltaproteobacteria bacterium]